MPPDEKLAAELAQIRYDVKHRFGEPTPTTPDDKLKMLMLTIMASIHIQTLDDGHLELELEDAAVRAAAVAYGRAVAIAELGDLAAMLETYTFEPYRHPAEIIHDRLAELRAEDAG